MGAVGKQAERKKIAVPREAAKKSPPVRKPAVKRPAKSPMKAVKPAPSALRPRSRSGPRLQWEKLVGLPLLALAIYIIIVLLGSGDPIPSAVALLGDTFGRMAVPILVLMFFIAAVLVVRPGQAARAKVARVLSGGLLVSGVTLSLLGAFGLGGSTGREAWHGLSSGLGLGVVLVLPVLLLGGLLLIGVPLALLLRVGVALLRVSLRTAAAALYSTIGIIVWLSRLPARLRTPPLADNGVAAPPVPELVWAPEVKKVEEPTPSLQEETQPLVPKIQVFQEEAAQARVVGDWSLPQITLLEVSKPQDVSEANARLRARIIEETLSTFGVSAHVREINPGPTVTQFALEPGTGTKVSRITSLQNDLALALAAPSIRMEAPVPGQSRVGLEIPNGKAATVRLRDVMDSAAYHNSKGKLKLALGRDVTGRAVVGDLAKMPHLLIAGATGAGKSVCLNSIIACFLFQHTPDELRFLMVDPKMVELKTFDGVPHLVWPVVTDVSKVVGVLKYAVGEMERRYKELSKLGLRNLEGYNRKRAAEGEPKLPHMVVIIDELADLMMAAPEEVEASICRLAQMARAVGIHLILATQRPSVDVLTGLIKANFPSRIAFAVSSGIDSRVILDTPGAERLLGRGDMLFQGPESAKPLRVQGTFVSDDEIESVVEHWKRLRPAEYDPEVGRLLEREDERTANPKEDPLYAQALEMAGTHARLSTSLLQRRLRIGYNRAARLMDALRDNGDLDTELDS